MPRLHWPRQSHHPKQNIEQVWTNFYCILHNGSYSENNRNGIHHGEELIPPRRMELAWFHSGNHRTHVPSPLHGQRIGAQSFQTPPSSQKSVGPSCHVKFSEHSSDFNHPAFKCDGTHAFLLFNIWDSRDEFMSRKAEVQMQRNWVAIRWAMECSGKWYAHVRRLPRVQHMWKQLWRPICSVSHIWQSCRTLNWRG